MKKCIIFFLLIVLVSVFAPSVSAEEHGLPCEPAWTFDEATGTITVSGNGYMHFLTRPEWYDLKSKITKVVITEGLVSVGPNAFSGCENLKSVSLAKSAVHINDSAFRNCRNLTDINLLHVRSIGVHAFNGCTSLTELTIPEGVTDIGDYAFAGCTGLRSVTFHDKLFGIGDAAFSGCTGLTSVTIPDSVEIICNGAFGNCTNLTDVKLGSGLKTLQRAFRRCTKLKSITIPDQVALLDSFTFENCTALEEVTIGSGVTQFNAYVFDNCTNLKQVYFLGKPPTFQYSAFREHTLTIYYWGGITQWKNVALYTGNVTFTPVFCEKHTSTPLAAREPTCTTEGLTAGSSCSVCKIELTPQQPIPKAPHTVVTVPGKAPTCTEDGYTESSTCSVCKRVLSSSGIISPTDHTYGEWVKNDTPNSTDWTHKRTCSACGYEDIAQGNAQPDTSENANQSSTTESAPLQDATENSAPATGNSPTEPVDTPKDVDGSKKALLLVGIGIILLGLATSGIVFLKPKFTTRNNKNNTKLP